MAENKWLLHEQMYVVHELDRCLVCDSYIQHCPITVDTSFMEARHAFENAIRKPVLSTAVVLQKDVKEVENEAIALEEELKEIETELKKVRQQEQDLLNLIMSHSRCQPKRS